MSKKEMIVNTALDEPLYRRLEREAAKDRRSKRAEVAVLITEAIDARERETQEARS